MLGKPPTHVSPHHTTGPPLPQSTPVTIPRPPHTAQTPHCTAPESGRHRTLHTHCTPPHCIDIATLPTLHTAPESGRRMTREPWRKALTNSPRWYRPTVCVAAAQASGGQVVGRAGRESQAASTERVGQALLWESPSTALDVRIHPLALLPRILPAHHHPPSSAHPPTHAPLAGCGPRRSPRPSSCAP